MTVVHGVRSVIALVAVGAAILFSEQVALAGQAVSIEWNAPSKLRDSSWVSGLATFGGSNALAVYESCVGAKFCLGRIYTRLSIDGGVTWGPSRQVGGDGSDMAAVAGRGSKVDLVWRSPGGDLRYARSTDAGDTFAPSMTIGESDGSAWEPNVARGPTGLVAVSWGDWPEFVDNANVILSTDGGRTFGNHTWWPTSDLSATDVAIGESVIYMGYRARTGAIRIKRSVDLGHTWTLVAELKHAYRFSLAAEGERALVAYESEVDDDVHVRATDDSGTTWSDPTTVSPITWDSDGPEVVLQGGIARLALKRWIAANRCFDGHEAVEGRLYYTESVDSLSWAAPIRASADSGCDVGWDTGVGYAGNIIVLYENEFDVVARAGA